MKLLKKLLPLGIVATTAAAVVPMTVSCGKKTGISNDFNYIPTVAQHEAKVFEFEAAQMEAFLAATEEYTANVAENLDILIQDIYFDASEYEKDYKWDKDHHYNTKYTFDFEVNNASLTKKTVSGDAYYLLSLDLNLSRNYEYDDYDFIGGSKKVIHTSMKEEEKTSIKNIPIYTYIDSSWNIAYDDVRVGSTDALTSISPDWELAYNKTSKEVVTTTSKDESSTSVEDKKDVYTFNKDHLCSRFELQAVTFDSYYMSLCTIDQKEKGE